MKNGEKMPKRGFSTMLILFALTIPAGTVEANSRLDAEGESVSLVGAYRSSLADVDEARIEFSMPLEATDAKEIAASASSDQPLQLLFRSGEWAGGVVLTGNDAANRMLLQEFLEESPAAMSPRPLVAVGASEEQVRQGLTYLSGPRSYRSEGARAVLGALDVSRQQRELSAGSLACSDCSYWINAGQGRPSVPVSGVLKQVRIQGLIEATTHSISGLSNVGYPARVRRVAMTQGRGGWIRPLYAYEHDYKIEDNGYVSTAGGYTWSTNLPGAYRDSRASDTDSLDFTVGSMFTWLFDSRKTYTIETTVAAGLDSAHSTALLAAQVLPNDGGRNMLEALRGSGCEFALDPSNGNTVPSESNGSYAWCAGVGAGRGSQLLADSYVSFDPFPIRASGTCRRWTHGQGAVFC